MSIWGRSPTVGDASFKNCTVSVRVRSPPLLESCVMASYYVICAKCGARYPHVQIQNPPSICRDCGASNIHTHLLLPFDDEATPLSLDVSLYEAIEHTCSHCNKLDYIDSRHKLFDANITHNLTTMAEEAGLYNVVWRPEENGIERAEQLIPFLEKGVATMKANRPQFEKFNAPNGWGLYEHFVPWLERYLAACQEHPTAFVYASR